MVQTVRTGVIISAGRSVEQLPSPSEELPRLPSIDRDDIPLRQGAVRQSPSMKPGPQNPIYVTDASGKHVHPIYPNDDLYPHILRVQKWGGDIDYVSAKIDSRTGQLNSSGFIIKDPSGTVIGSLSLEPANTASTRLQQLLDRSIKPASTAQLPARPVVVPTPMPRPEELISRAKAQAIELRALLTGGNASQLLLQSKISDLIDTSKELPGILRDADRRNVKLSESTLKGMALLSKELIALSIELQVSPFGKNATTGDLAERLASDSSKVISQVTTHLPTFRERFYIGDGFFVTKGDWQNLLPLVGLMKATGDIKDKSMPPAEAAKLAGAVHYDVATEVVNWAQGVISKSEAGLSTAARDQLRLEKAFIMELVDAGVLLRSGSSLSPLLRTGNVPSLIVTPPKSTEVTHEIAHEVEQKNSQYCIAWAKASFRQLSPESKALFNDFIALMGEELRVETPRNQDQRMKEYFAYANQSGDWRTHAKAALGRRIHEDSVGTSRPIYRDPPLSEHGSSSDRDEEFIRIYEQSKGKGQIRTK